MKYSTRLHIHNITIILVAFARLIMNKLVDRTTANIFVIVGLVAVRELGMQICRCPHCKSPLYKSGAHWPPKNTCKVCENKVMPDADPAKAPFFAKIPAFNIFLWVVFAAGCFLVLKNLGGYPEVFPWPQYGLGLALVLVSYLLIPWDNTYRHALKHQPPEERLGE